MKKTLIVALLCAMAYGVKAQYGTDLITSPTPKYVYVGSLNLADNNLGNAQKLKVEVFGGSWGSEDVGETTYYIANRGGLNIHQIVLGSSNNNLFALQAYDNGTDNIDFYIVNTGWTAAAIRSVILAGPTPVTQLINNTSSNNTPPGTLHPLTIVPVMNTDEFGNMSIGTNTIDTDFKLSVNGGIRARKIVVETAWADHVFTTDYNLRPLHKVADYIREHHHLPDVPSAAEIKQNGVNVGENQALLLKKIEELTLYLLQQQKEINALKQQIKGTNK